MQFGFPILLRDGGEDGRGLGVLGGFGAGFADGGGASPMAGGLSVGAAT